MSYFYLIFFFHIAVFSFDSCFIGDSFCFFSIKIDALYSEINSNEVFSASSYGCSTPSNISEYLQEEKSNKEFLPIDESVQLNVDNANEDAELELEAVTSQSSASVSIDESAELHAALNVIEVITDLVEFVELNLANSLDLRFDHMYSQLKANEFCENLFTINYISTYDMIADIFTKSLPAQKFNLFKEKMNIVSM